jgi:hypothetical protein
LRVVTCAVSAPATTSAEATMPAPTTRVAWAGSVAAADSVTPSGARGSSVIGTVVWPSAERYVVASVTEPVSGSQTAGTPSEGKVTSTVTGAPPSLSSR